MVYQYLSNASEWIEHNQHCKVYVNLCKEYHKVLSAILQRYTHEKFITNEIDWELSWQVYDFAMDVLSKHCEYSILCVLIVTDMIHLLLRIYEISQLEMKVSTHKMRMTQRIIATILSHRQLKTYRTCVNDMDPMMVLKWQTMIDEICADPPPQIVSKRLLQHIYNQKTHALDYHVKCDNYMICKCHLICCRKYIPDNLVQFWDLTSKDTLKSYYYREE